MAALCLNIRNKTKTVDLRTGNLNKVKHFLSFLLALYQKISVNTRSVVFVVLKSIKNTIPDLLVNAISKTSGSIPVLVLSDKGNFQ